MASGSGVWKANGTIPDFAKPAIRLWRQALTSVSAARIGSGPWSQPTSIAFEIQQPWWRTWPAIAAWLILIASAALGGFRWRMKNLRKRTRQLESITEVSAGTVELAMANADLERLSITDPLTGLKDGRLLEFSIAEDLARIRRSFQPLPSDWHSLPEETANISFLVIDIDHFKLINDSLGMPQGITYCVRWINPVRYCSRIGHERALGRGRISDHRTKSQRK